MFVRLLQGLKQVPQGDGTLLANTVAVLTSEVMCGNLHNYTSLPVLVGGRGGGIIAPGRHLRMGDATAPADIAALWLALLQGFGVSVSRFGDLGVSQPLAGLASS